MIPRSRKALAGALIAVPLMAGVLYAGLQGLRTPPASSLSLRPLPGWRIAPAAPDQQPLLARFQAQAGMELKTTLASTDGQSVIAVFVRPLAISSDTPATTGEVLAALAATHQLAPCADAKAPLAADYAACVAPVALPQPAAAALVVPARQDRYFIALALSRNANRPPPQLLADLLRHARVTGGQGR